MTIRFYLDEMFSQLIARIARGFGLDVTSAHEERREGWSDDDQFAVATREGRYIVTQNYADFDRITKRRIAAGLPHPGVLLVPPSVINTGPAGVARALRRFAWENPEGLQPYEQRWLVAEDRD